MNSSQLNKSYFDFILWHNGRFSLQAPEGKCLQVPSVLLGRLGSGAGRCSSGVVGLSVPSQEQKGIGVTLLERACGLEKGLRRSSVHRYSRVDNFKIARKRLQFL